MHHARAGMHAGIANPGGGENVPGIPGACATHNFMYLARGPPPGDHCTWIRRAASSMCSYRIARKSAVRPISSTTFTSAPRSIKSSPTAAEWVDRHALKRAVSIPPQVERCWAFTSAPASSNMVTMSGWRWVAWHRSRSWQASSANKKLSSCTYSQQILGSAPLSSNSRTASRSTTSTAHNSG